MLWRIKTHNIHDFCTSYIHQGIIVFYLNRNRMSQTVSAKLSIAPMIDWTYSHFRMFMRFLAPQALLYTEMQTTGAIQNNPNRALEFSTVEHPIALQLGGADPIALAESARQAEHAGYDEVNLNLGSFWGLFNERAGSRRSLYSSD
jgi:hypothetical protein